MAMRNGGIIGVLNQPTNLVASGIWSLKEQEKAQKAGSWPGILLPVTITSVNTTVTQSSNDVSGINLSSISLGDFLVIVYGSEGAGTVTSATLSGTSVSIDITSEDTISSPASVAIMFVVASAAIAGDSNATLNITSSDQGATQFRCACSIFKLSRNVSVVDTVAFNTVAPTLSTTINFSSGALFVAYYDADDGFPTLTGVANQINEGMGSGSSDFSIGSSDSTNSGSATHAIGYTGAVNSGNAYAAVVYS